jgi:hypothetical protein
VYFSAKTVGFFKIYRILARSQNEKGCFVLHLAKQLLILIFLCMSLIIGIEGNVPGG